MLLPLSLTEVFFLEGSRKRLRQPTHYQRHVRRLAMCVGALPLPISLAYRFDAALMERYFQCRTFCGILPYADWSG
jgi:hypothetical protein